MEQDEGWREYKAHFGKRYVDATDEWRHYEAFIHNRDFVEQHASRLRKAENLEGSSGHGAGGPAPSYELSLSRFSDWLDEELDKRFQPMPEWEDEKDLGADQADDEYGGLPIEGGSKSSEGGDESFSSYAHPSAVDWSTTNNKLGRGVVTGVKDQDACGACWAFTAVGATEASVAMNTGIVESLSVQELLDCDKKNDQGCVGGTPAFAFPYIASHGLSSEQRYPYLGAEDLVDGCLEKRRDEPVSAIRGFRVLPPNDEALMLGAVAMTVCP